MSVISAAVASVLMAVISSAVDSVLIALLSVLAALPVDRDAAPRERELRITLGQIPQSSQRQMTTIRMAKLPGVSSEQRVPISEHRLMAGLKVVDGTETSDLFVPIASSFFLKGISPLEFLPSKISRFGKMYGQFNSRRNLWVGSMSVVALTAIAFLYQIFRKYSVTIEFQRLCVHF